MNEYNNVYRHFGLATGTYGVSCKWSFYARNIGRKGAESSSPAGEERRPVVNYKRDVTFEVGLAQGGRQPSSGPARCGKP